MPTTSKKLVVHVDPELREYLQPRRITTGASVSELIRRAINLTRYSDEQAAKEQHAQAH